MLTDKFSKAGARILIGAGVLAFIIGVIGGITEADWPFSGNLLLSLILAFIGLLCAGLGAERLGPMEKLIDATKNIGRFRWINTGAEVYEEAERMVRECNDRCIIRATDLTPNREKLTSDEFISYITALGNRIEQATQKGGNVTYRLVFADDPKDPHRYGRKGLEKRRELMNRPGVLEQLWARYVDNPCPLEVLIIGSSVLLGFPTAAQGGSRPLGAGILIEDAESAHEFEQWYDGFLWGRAKDVK